MYTLNVRTWSGSQGLCHLLEIAGWYIKFIAGETPSDFAQMQYYPKGGGNHSLEDGDWTDSDLRKIAAQAVRVVTRTEPYNRGRNDWSIPYGGTIIKDDLAERYLEIRLLPKKDVEKAQVLKFAWAEKKLALVIDEVANAKNKQALCYHVANDLVEFGLVNPIQAETWLQRAHRLDEEMEKVLNQDWCPYQAWLRRELASFYRMAVERWGMLQ